MGGRFGKYGDLKRRKALERGRQEASRLEKAGSIAMRGRKDAAFPQPGDSSAKAPKTHKTAVVVIPPESLWDPIQGLRKVYDRHYRRWMPHITLLYPFRPFSTFDDVSPLLAEACLSLAPVEIRLARFGLFSHARRKATLYLVPEPANALKKIHHRLLEAVPDCRDTARFAGGFTPHLSVGQAPAKRARELCAGWQAAWQPLTFILKQIQLIRRNDPPGDVFRVGAEIPLGP